MLACETCPPTVTIDGVFYSRAPKESAKPKLPKPSLGENALQCSVFSNPFVEAELAKSAILEKHVKMVYVDFLFITIKITIFQFLGTTFCVSTVFTIRVI